MTRPTPLPDLAALKAQAKRLRTTLASEGNFISHSEALEFIARQYGYRDWNTLHAAAGSCTYRWRNSRSTTMRSRMICSARYCPERSCTQDSNGFGTGRLTNRAFH